EVSRAISPDLAKAGNIVGDNGAAGQSRFQRSHTKRLVTRSSGINRSTAREASKLSFGLRALQCDKYLFRGQLGMGADGRARRIGGMVRGCDAHGTRV